MKKIALLVMMMFLLSILVIAYDDCPRGNVGECDHPCGLYVDSDNSGTCDHAETDPALLALDTTVEITTTTLEFDEHGIEGQELKTMTVQQVADEYQISSSDYAKALSEYYQTTINPSDSFQTLHDNLGIAPSVAKDIALSVREGVSVSEDESSSQPSSDSKPYNFFPLTITTLILYLTTYLLNKKKKIKLLTHKRIWNIILLLSFLASGISGLLLVIRINYGIGFNLPFSMLYVHVETGIILAIVSIVHILEHIYFYKAIFRKSK